MLYLFVMILFGMLYGVIMLLLLYQVYAMVSGAPFVPSAHNKVSEMVDIARLQKNERVMDLGSGDGRIVCAVAPFCLVSSGVEISPLLYLFSKLRVWKNGLKNVVLKRDTLWNVDLSRYDVVFIYFIPHWMNKLEKKIKKEMRPGSRVVSHAFQFKNWKSLRTCGNITVYIV
jgi:cyclopropane fatty-acyl-phospholipid synthase-like methyltransferase